MKFRNHALLTLLVCLFIHPLASEPTDSHRALAERLLQVEGGKAAFEEGVNTILDRQIAAQPQFAKFREVFEKWQHQYAGWDKLEPLYLDLICDVYTEEDLELLIEFYETEVGQKLASKGQELSMTVMQEFERVAAESQTELRLMIEKRVMELRQEVSGLLPEWEEKSPTDPLEEEIILHRTHAMVDANMEEFVFPTTVRELYELTEQNPHESAPSMSPGKALKVAFEEHFREFEVSEEAFRKSATIKMDYHRRRRSAETPDLPEKQIWFYVVEVGFVSGAITNTPPGVLILFDGQVIKPLRK